MDLTSDDRELARQRALDLYRVVDTLPRPRTTTSCASRRRSAQSRSRW